MPRRPVPVVRTRDHRAIKRLTSLLLAREREGNRADAEARVAVGGILRRVRSQLVHGEWLKWLEEQVPYSARTAQRAIALHDWAKANPREFERLAPLGASKLYLLSTAKPADLQRLLRAKQIAVPGTTTRAPLDRLSFKQLLQVVKLPVKPLVEELARKKAIKRVTRGIRRIAETTADLAVADVPRETAIAWHAGLLDAADIVARRFDLA